MKTDVGLEIEESSILSKIKSVLWPIQRNELNKFLPMAGIMFCILFNYSMLRSIKDALVVTSIGPEAIGFLKTYFVLPSAILFTMLYTYLCNIMNQKKIFYLIISFMAGYFLLFGLIIYPNTDFFHARESTINDLSLLFSPLKWFIKILGNWSYALFYILSELWGSVVIGLLFWQFANQITRTEEAKRFYPMFGMIGNFGLVLTGFILTSVLPKTGDNLDHHAFSTAIIIPVAACLVMMLLYMWINKNVVDDTETNSSSKAKKKKIKLSFGESMKVIFTTKYLFLIAALLIAYGISMVLVEGIWKAEIRMMYPSHIAYTRFMGEFQKYQGIIAIFFMIVGGNILRKVSWKSAALFTPLMILITGIIFFFVVFFGKSLNSFVEGIIFIQPAIIAIFIGALQNILSKATKYSLFDSTKEMSYIPLDQELKTKGKAAVDVIGGRLGKSGGGIILSTTFLIFPNLSFTGAMPFFASIFFCIVVCWIIVVFALNKEYQKKLNESES